MSFEDFLRDLNNTPWQDLLLEDDSRLDALWSDFLRRSAQFGPKGMDAMDRKLRELRELLESA